MGNAGGAASPWWFVAALDRVRVVELGLELDPDVELELESADRPRRWRPSPAPAPSTTTAATAMAIPLRTLDTGASSNGDPGASGRQTGST